MESRSLRVGPDGSIHSTLRDQLSANPLHNLSYAQNVGYALPGFKTTLATSESVGQDSILKGWQYLSASGVSSLNVSSAGGFSSAAHATGTSAFPGLNHMAPSMPASAPSASAAAAAAAASAAAIRTQQQSRHAVSLEGSSRPTFALQPEPTNGLSARWNAGAVQLSGDSVSQHQLQQHSFTAGAATSLGTSAAAVAIQHTLPASLQQPSSRSAPMSSSDHVLGGRLSESTDRVSFTIPPLPLPHSTRTLADHFGRVTFAHQLDALL